MKYEEFEIMEKQSQEHILSIITIVNSTMNNLFNKKIKNILALNPDSILMSNLSSEGKAEIILINQKAHDIIKQIWLGTNIDYLDIIDHISMNFTPPNDLSEIKDIKTYFYAYSESVSNSQIAYWKNFIQNTEAQKLSLLVYTERLYQSVTDYKRNTNNISKNVKEVVLAEFAK